MSRERGCCRFSGFTTTAYPLRVEQCLPKEGATGRDCPTRGLRPAASHEAASHETGSCGIVCRRAPMHGLTSLHCKLEEAP